MIISWNWSTSMVVVISITRNSIFSIIRVISSTSVAVNSVVSFASSISSMIMFRSSTIKFSAIILKSFTIKRRNSDTVISLVPDAVAAAAPSLISTRRILTFLIDPMLAVMVFNIIIISSVTISTVSEESPARI